MKRQVVEPVDELVEVAAKIRSEGLRPHVDEESPKVAHTICDADPRAKNECCTLRGADLAKLKDAIELAGGSSTHTPTWRASCRCLTGCPPRDIPKVVSFG
jgi:hypothetical protein